MRGVKFFYIVRFKNFTFRLNLPYQELIIIIWVGDKTGGRYSRQKDQNNVIPEHTQY
jgi:hypothetical protein